MSKWTKPWDKQTPDEQFIIVLGVGTTLISIASWFPQFIQSLTSNDFSGLSGIFLLVNALSQVLWIWYGVKIYSWTVIVASLVVGLMVLTVLIKLGIQTGTIFN